MLAFRFFSGDRIPKLIYKEKCCQKQKSGSEYIALHFCNQKKYSQLELSGDILVFCSALLETVF